MSYKYDTVWKVRVRGNDIHQDDLKNGLQNGKYADYMNWRDTERYPDAYECIKANGTASVLSEKKLTKQDLKFITSQLSNFVYAGVLLKGEKLLKNDAMLEKFINKFATDYQVGEVGVRYAIKYPMNEESHTNQYDPYNIKTEYQQLADKEVLVDNRDNEWDLD